jgi:hypothetical protein
MSQADDILASTVGSITFTKQRNQWVQPGTCYAIRSMTRPNHFCVLSREEVSDMAAVSAINELLRHEAEQRIAADEATKADVSRVKFEELVDDIADAVVEDDSRHMGPDD